jgi:hypothetical protein
MKVRLLYAESNDQSLTALKKAVRTTKKEMEVSVGEVIISLL